MRCTAGLVCVKNDDNSDGESCVRPSYCAVGTVGCQCSWAGECIGMGNRCNRTSNICHVRDVDACAGTLGCSCLRDGTPDDPSGGCAVPSICSHGLCSLPTRTDSVHGGEPGDPCDPCDGSCWLGFHCLQSVSRCVACVGDVGCPCAPDGECGRADLVCQPHTFRSNNATAATGLATNVWGYDVHLRFERQTVRALTVQTILFDVIQKLANLQTLFVRDSDLMMVHGRKLHVIVSLDGTLFTEAFWHIHPDEFGGDFGAHKLQIRFPRAGDYVISFDFMHMVDGLMRAASVSKFVTVAEAPELLLDRDDDGGELDSLTKQREQAIAASDEPWRRTVAALPLAAESDSYRRLITPMTRIPKHMPRALVRMQLEQSASIHAGACRLVTFHVLDENGRPRNGSLGVYLHAPVHIALMMATIPRDSPFIIHAHGYTSEAEARKLGCRQNHMSYRGPPRFEPVVYAMLPFPLAGTWRIVAQMRYILPDNTTETMLAAAFEVGVGSRTADDEHDDKDRVEGGICVYTSALVENDPVIAASEIARRQRLWQAMHASASGARVHSIARAAGIGSAIVVGALLGARYWYRRRAAVSATRQALED
jgi:hypothetical protein